MSAPTPKLIVAVELLDRALRLYYEGGSDFSALHLAGAAEELLGKHVEDKVGQSSFASLKAAAVCFSKYLNAGGEESTPKAIAVVMNRAKNSTKHMDDMSDGSVSFDPRAEAHALLDRAVTNFYQAMSHFQLQETDLIRRFNQELVAGA